MALKDLLAQLPEDMKIKVGDKEFDRAALLTEFETEITPLNSRVTELTTREQQLKEQLDAAVAAANLRTNEPHDDGKKPDTKQSLLEAMKELVSGESEYDFNDPYSKQLLGRIGKMLKDETGGVSTGYKSELEELKQGILGIAAMTLEGRMNSDFSRHKWPDGYDASKAWSEAIKNGYVNPTTKLPDIARYNKDVMAPLELKGAAEKARQEGIEEGKKLAQEEMRARQTGRGRLGLVPRPGGGAVPGGKTGAAAKAPTSIAEAIDQIEITDADIAANMGLRVGG
jgi:hypothetical protein